MPEKFNPCRSRAKRPCPIWVDAFQRDTQHLEADEIGAYFLILITMWSKENCSFPDNQQQLARVSRVSTRLWKSRISKVILPLFIIENGEVISKRLRKEATYVERHVTQQRCRKTGEKPDNLLKDIPWHPTTDKPRKPPRQEPTYNLQPTFNNSSKEEYVPIDEASEAISIYNGFTKSCGWPEVQKLTKPRRTSLLARLKDCGGLDGWKIALEKASQSHFLTGQTDRPFFASFDWLTKPANFTKLMEGNYENRTNNGTNTPQGAERIDPALEQIARLSGL